LLDTLINELGINCYSFRIYSIISLFFLADGGEMIVMSLLITKLSALWDLSELEKGLLGSAVFFGFFIGAFISGKFSDLYGRKPAFIIGAVTSAIFALVSAFSPNYYALIVFRSMFGIGVGISVPAASSLATEITPTKYRSYVLNLLWIFFPLGEVISVVSAKYLLPLPEGWRYLLGIVSIPNIISCIISFFINESPRYYISNQKYEQGFVNLNNLLSHSKEKIELTQEQQDRIIQEENIELKSNYTSLCKKKYVRLTIHTCGIFFICSFCYYGMVYILPQLMEDINKNMKDKTEAADSMFRGLIFSAIAETPAVFFTCYIANVKCIGRLKTLGFGFALTMAFTIFAAVYMEQINIFGALYKFAITIPFGVIYVYTCEAFPTKIRSIAVGVTNSLTRLGGILTPIITQILFANLNYSPFIVFGGLSLVGFFLSIFLPFETVGRDIV